MYAVKISNLHEKYIVSNTCKQSTKSTSRWATDAYYPYRHCKEEIQTSEEINKENEKRVRIKFQSCVLAKKCRDSDSEGLRWDHRACF